MVRGPGLTAGSRVCTPRTSFLARVAHTHVVSVYSLFTTTDFEVRDGVPLYL